MAPKLYKSIDWFQRTWKSKELMAITESDIAQKRTELDKSLAENERIYSALKASHESARAEYRRLYPRRDFPPELKRTIPRPPNLLQQWEDLVGARRRLLIKKAYAERKAIADEERRKQEKKAAFLTRMHNGRFKAMQRRQSSVNGIINHWAEQFGVTLSEKAIEKRLEELITGLMRLIH